MKAPDKKYPLSVVANLCASTPQNEVAFMPDKIYFDGVDTSTTPRLAINEIYIRKDALLEWVKEKEDFALTKAVKLAYKTMIDKINSM